MPTRGGARRISKRIPLTSQLSTKVTGCTAIAARETSKLTGDRWQYYLVQRMIPEDRPELSGVDRYFAFDDMEQSEFEWGNVPRCLREIRQAGELVITTAKLYFEGVTRRVYFIGPRDGMSQKVVDFQVWLDENVLAAAYTEFEYHFTKNYGILKKKYMRSRAWLSLKNHVFFTLEKQHAKQILQGLLNPPKKA